MYLENLEKRMRGRRKKMRKDSDMQVMSLEEFIRSEAPEGTSDEVIEKSVATVTSAVLRGLGKIGEKLKGIIGRVVQFFRGDPGVWITQGGKKVFVKIDPKGITGPTAAKAKNLKEFERRSQGLQKRWNKGIKPGKQADDFADGVISALQDALTLL